MRMPDFAEMDSARSRVLIGPCFVLMEKYSLYFFKKKYYSFSPFRRTMQRSSPHFLV